MAIYEIINPPAFSKKSRQGKFIYVLSFNAGNQTAIPFYVGQSSGLTARFGNHQMVMWHFAKFGVPARIWIAGEVPSAKADFAEQDLITRLSDAGYRLANRAINQSRAKRFQREDPLLEMSNERIRAYLCKGFPRTHVLDGWKRKWIPSPPGYVAEGTSLSTKQVVDYVTALEYPSEPVRNVSLAIAEHHDPAIGYSRIILKEAMRGVPGAKRVYKQPRSLTHLWFFNRMIVPEHLHDFRLTSKHMAAAKRAHVARS